MTFSAPRWLRRVGLAALVAAPVLVIGACDSLDIDPFSQVEVQNFYRTPSEVQAAVAPVYGQLRAPLFNYYNLSQVSTDENIVPTRGSDWGDGGRWLAIHRHGWDANLSDLNGAWNDAFTGVARANKVIEDIGNLDEDIQDQETILAELRAIRAYFYYQLLDLFGRVPIIGDDELSVDLDNPPPANTRAEVFDFIESELNATRPLLPVTQVQAGGRMSQDIADAILANMYINCEVFRGTLTAGGITRAAPCWQQAFDKANGLITSGQYQLASDYLSIFSVDNASNPEHIFRIEHLAADGLGLTIPMRMTHYNQFSPSPWNGFATLAETYDQYDEDDPRRDIYLTGQAFNFETGEAVEDRNNQPLIFTPDFPGGVENTTEGGGYRLLKYAVDVNHVNGNHGNDYALFRIGEMYLIRAEAAYRLNGGGLDDLNELRTARGYTETLSSIDPATILRERLYEMAGEAKRRQDLIRINDAGAVNPFLAAYFEKPQSEPYRVFYPIPQSQLDANPNLTQSPGY